MSEFSGRRTAIAVTLLVVLTAVIPPAGAYALARWRVVRANANAVAAVALFRERIPVLRELAGEATVIAGPGRMPRGQGLGEAWVQNPVSLAASFDEPWPIDPWGRAYLLDVGALVERGAGLLISAGPNGEIETAIGASAPAGDDVAAVVR